MDLVLVGCSSVSGVVVALGLFLVTSEMSINVLVGEGFPRTALNG